MLENAAMYSYSIHVSIIIDRTEGNKKRASCTDKILERLNDLEWRGYRLPESDLGKEDTHSLSSL